MEPSLPWFPRRISNAEWLSRSTAPAHDRTDPGSNAFSAWCGHALQDQGSQPQDQARVEKAYRGTDALNESSFERRPIQYLYRDGDEFHFMDAADFSQFSFTADDLRDQVSFMTENMEGIQALVVDDEVIAIELPDTVELPIIESAPGVRGNSATGRTKPATLSTGHIVQVPEHLDQGVIVRVDTRTGEYLGRAN